MANDFTYHKISEKEKQDIKKQAKKLLDEFSPKLDKIKVKDSHFSVDSGMREEGEGWNTDETFKSLMFTNAPFVEDDFLVAEKGDWK
jgi:hypothetical protein